MARNQKRPDLSEIDIPLAATGEIDAHKLSASERRRRRERIRRFLFTFILVTLILMAAALILFLYSRRDKISSRSIRTAWNSFWGVEFSAADLNWNLTGNASFVPFQGGVIAADTSGMRSVGADGIETVMDTASFPAPVLSVTEDRVLLFDKSTHVLIYSDGSKQILSFRETDDIRSAVLSESGLAVTSGEEGYLSVARAYDKNGSLLVEYKTPAYFASSALLSSDRKTLVFLGIAAGDVSMESSALLIDIDKSEVSSEIPFGESLPLGIKEVKKNTCSVVFDDGVRTFDIGGTLKGSYAFGNMELHSFAFGEDFAVCVLRRHLAGERFAVMTFDENAAVEGSYAEPREPGVLSAAGRLVALSFGSVAEVYPASLTTHTDFDFNAYVDKLALKESGTVIALTDGILHIS